MVPTVVAARGRQIAGCLQRPHGVAERGQNVPVWGEAAPEEDVTIKFRDQTKTAKADAKGLWRIPLDALTAGGPDEMTISGKNVVILKDVLVGEVWVGSGQSNMAGGVNGYAKGDEVLAKLAAAAPYNKLRLIHGKGGWQEATVQHVNGFSAILFAFGLKLQQELDVPVGLIQGAVGGTPSGAWLTEEALTADGPCQESIKKYAATFDQVLANYESKTLPNWEKQACRSEGRGKTGAEEAKSTRQTRHRQ